MEKQIKTFGSNERAELNIVYKYNIKRSIKIASFDHRKYRKTVVACSTIPWLPYTALPRRLSTLPLPLVVPRRHDLSKKKSAIASVSDNRRTIGSIASTSLFTASQRSLPFNSNTVLPDNSLSIRPYLLFVRFFFMFFRRFFSSIRSNRPVCKTVRLL